MTTYSPHAYFGSECVGEIGKINTRTGRDFSLGCDVEVVMKGIAREGMIVGTEKGAFRIMFEDDKEPHRSVFDAARCRILK